MQYYFTDSRTIGITPARVNRETGDVYINQDVWDTYPEEYKEFILAHEQGHYKAQETNELFADHYALMHVAGLYPESLKFAVRTITDILPGTNPNQQTRILNILRLALLFDLLHHPQASTKTELLKVETELARYKNLQQLKDYEMILSQMRKGRPTDYDFPGYDTRMFQPILGSLFTDVPLDETGEAIDDPTEQIETTAPGTCDNVLFLEMPRRFRLSFDLKTFAIIVLVALTVILITKLNRQ